MTLNGSPTERPGSLTTVVYDSVRNLIIEQVLPPGSPAPEAPLAERLNASRTQVREALLRLSQSGLIISDGRREGRVPDRSVDRLRVAGGGGGEAALLAADAHTPTGSTAMTGAVAASLAAVRQDHMDAFRAHDRAFHSAVATAAADNPYLLPNVIDSYDLVWMIRLRDPPRAATWSTRPVSTRRSLTR